MTKTRNPTPERETAEFKSTKVLSYIKGVSEPLRRHLQQQGIRTVFKSDTTLRSQLVRPKDPADPNKQNGVVYKIPCTCGKVCIGETGPPMQERKKEQHRDIRSHALRIPRLQSMPTEPDTSRCGTKPSLLTEKTIGTQGKWRRPFRLNPNNINRDSGAEILEAWMPTIRKHQNQRTPEETMVHGNNSRIEMHQSQQTTTIYNAVPQPVDPIAWRRHAVSSRNVAFHIKWPCRETTEQTYNIILLPRWATTYFIT